MSSTPTLAAERVTRGAQVAIRIQVQDAAAATAIAVCALVLHREGLFGGPAFYELDTRLFY